mgnify:CR=1 FL=1
MAFFSSLCVKGIEFPPCYMLVQMQEYLLIGAFVRISMIVRRLQFVLIFK